MSDSIVNDVVENDAILEIENLKVHFPISGGLFSKKQIVKAVDGISISIKPGETFGLVGESGCGKSTLGRAIVKINPVTSGSIKMEGKDITKLRGKALDQFRKDVQMIFQDPYASLNPRMTVGEIVREPMDIHDIFDTKEQRDNRVRELLELVGLKPDHIRRYPHEFSGGQRQRIGIARTLALNPKFVVCDEPISALDVSIQAQVINLLEKIQKEMGISYLFIAHDLSMVKHISDRIGVMYLGNMMEVGESDDVYHNPLHPYTQALLSSVPIPDPKIAREKQRIVLDGELPSPIDPPKGCVFCTRCPKATDKCRQEKPELREIKGRLVACHLYDE